MGDVEVERLMTKTASKATNRRAHREELGHVGPVVRLACRSDLLVHGDGHVPAVEGEHGKQVEDPDEDVDA